jgi:hypothetical protein
MRLITPFPLEGASPSGSTCLVDWACPVLVVHPQLDSIGARIHCSRQG